MLLAEAYPYTDEPLYIPPQEKEALMGKDIKVGCARPTGGLVGETHDAETPAPKDSS